MATLLLSAAGAAVGAGFGGTVLGLSGAVIGRAVGATLGRAIDQRLLGGGTDPVEIGRVDRFRLMGASEGAPVARLFGKARIAGQVIWATRFQEQVATSGSGKGTPQPKTTTYSYSVSVAIALCEGKITSVGRIWADGVEIAPGSLNMRVYRGGEGQLPDPKIEAVEGAGQAPAYRGIAYVVIEDLALAPFGNRVPQFSFEVVRPAQGRFTDEVMDLQRAVRAVALIPGTGEYSLATTAVHYAEDPGVHRSANVHSPAGMADMQVALRQLGDEAPDCGSVSLVVSWFGSDLRCSECAIQPKVEQTEQDGAPMAWSAGGLARAAAGVVPLDDGRPVYGGTPADQAVVEAIRAIREAGKEVMFYPFILMEQMAGNGLADPWTGAASQPVLPWRGRITLSKAPGVAESPDQTAQAEAEVAAFFGTAQASDFATEGEAVVYSGPDAWRYRRFILHYAHLCALAGGVDAFCIGSEMVGLTQIRGAGNSFPAVEALRQLAADVRSILGPGVKLTYAADWSEYFGYHVGGDVFFHLDPLWADANIDMIGIDNYMPVSDWRDGTDHADARWGTIYNLDYLKSNIAGGEGYDWYYASSEAASQQRRTPIQDGAHGEHWVYRFKDLKGWWSNLHRNRIGGERVAQPTAWVPRSKPIWFTEYGCAAIDKGTNQPNKFLDPKSSESSLPKFSNGRRDDLIQMQYLRAFADYWNDPAANPWSDLYAGRMVDMAHAHVWAWDARPFPYFPADREAWGDGDNYARGHWLTGRVTNQPLEAVVAEICEGAGLTAYDVSGLHGVVRGYWLSDVTTARSALQPLMLAHAFDVSDHNGALRFRMRAGRPVATLDEASLAVTSEIDGNLEASRAPEVEVSGRLRLGFSDAAGDYDFRQVEAVFPDEASHAVSQSEFPMVLTMSEARATVERWLAESRVSREGARFHLPPSALDIVAGDVVEVRGLRYRIDQMELGEGQLAEATRVEAEVYSPSDAADDPTFPRRFVPPVPTHPIFLDLPLLSGDEVPHAPHLAVFARPWPGTVAVWDANRDDGYTFNRVITAAATIGRTESVLRTARCGLWDRGEPLRVRLFGGTLSSADPLAVLDGANTIAIGDGSADRWEILQFCEATLVAPRTYDLSLRLRGQLGTDALVPEVWPIGSRIVLLNSAVQQISLASSLRGRARHYRIGVAARGYDDPACVHRIEAFAGNGLRPYAPVHLRAFRAAGGDLEVRWVRRTRIDGDSWDAANVPLGEEAETYLLRVRDGSAIRREVTTSEPKWTYPVGQQVADGVGASFRVEVAQVSGRFGPGLVRGIDV